MKTYTGRGDEGMTDPRDMARMSKTSHQIEAYRTVDEVNAPVGTIRPTGYDDVDDILEAAQNHLHIVQADLANPDPGEGDPQIAADCVDELGVWMDEADEELDPLMSFVLPGGSETGAELHHVHAVSRQAGRRAVSLAAEEPVNEEVVAYLNRLSDALFVSARLVNIRDRVPEELPTY